MLNRRRKMKESMGKEDDIGLRSTSQTGKYMSSLNAEGVESAIGEKKGKKKGKKGDYLFKINKIKSVKQL